MSVRVDTRQRMIEGAKELVRRNGFGATSFRDVWEHTGTPRGSVYFHFPGGKEQLGVEVVRSALDTLKEMTLEAASESRTPQTFVKCLAVKIADRLSNSSYREGCPIAAVAVEMSSSSPVLRAEAGKAFGAWAGAVADQLVQKGIATAEASDFANVAVGGYEGALLVSKARMDRFPLEQMGDFLARSIREAPPAS